VNAIVAFLNTLTDGWVDGPGLRDAAPAGTPARFLEATPNPFASLTRIRFDLAVPGAVSLTVFDVQGRLARTLLPETALTPGPHEITWDGRNDRGEPVTPGVYFYRLNGKERSDVRRIVLLP
jgi:hypothetical protein